VANFKIDPKALRDLEKQLSQEVAVPLDGSESNAMRKVKEQYKKKTGAALNDAAARDIVRKARGK
jgi:hypothetical protein